MPNVLGVAKRNISRSRWHCVGIQKQVGWIYDHYVDDHPDFAEHCFTAARFAKELQDYLEKVHQELCNM